MCTERIVVKSLKFYFSVLCLLIAMWSVHCAADSAEIEQLIAFVAQTQCEYERNGTRHTGAEAVTHIKKKYDYYREDIETTEDFIRLAAKQSALSGKEYRVHCPNEQSISSETWLLNELTRIRQTTEGSTQQDRALKR